MKNLDLNEKSLVYHLKQYRAKKFLKYYPETTSTNDIAKQMCHEGKNKELLVVANYQTAGKGRTGRSFYSPKGSGIYFSVVHEIAGNEKNFDLISSIAGLAVRDTLYNMFNIDAKIKWPNDILVNDKKICGILCEIINENGRPKYVVIGIGVNVEKIDFPDELEYTATSIGNEYTGTEELDHNEILVDIVNNIDRYVIRNNALNSYENTDVINRLKAHSATVGQLVHVIKPDREFDARAVDIDVNGGLVISNAEGTSTLTSGEVIHIR